MKCTTCDRELGENSVIFKCPNCKKITIRRCNHCRKISVKYKCSCGFEGP